MRVAPAEPSPGGHGDELVTPANVIVGDNPKPSVDIMPIQDPNAPPQDGSHRIDQQVQTRALNAFTEEMRRQLSMAKQISDPTAGGHEDYKPVTPLHPRYRGDLERAHQNIDRAKNILERHYARLERSLTQKAATNWDRWDRELTHDLDGLVGAIVAAEGDLYAKRFLGEFERRRPRTMCVRSRRARRPRSTRRLGRRSRISVRRRRSRGSRSTSSRVPLVSAVARRGGRVRRRRVSPPTLRVA
jgi:hypothetical protein